MFRPARTASEGGGLVRVGGGEARWVLQVDGLQRAYRPRLRHYLLPIRGFESESAREKRSKGQGMSQKGVGVSRVRAQGHKEGAHEGTRKE